MIWDLSWLFKITGKECFTYTKIYMKKINMEDKFKECMQCDQHT